MAQAPLHSVSIRICVCVFWIRLHYVQCTHPNTLTYTHTNTYSRMCVCTSIYCANIHLYIYVYHVHTYSIYGWRDSWKCPILHFIDLNPYTNRGSGGSWLCMCVRMWVCVSMRARALVCVCVCVCRHSGGRAHSRPPQNTYSAVQRAGIFAVVTEARGNEMKFLVRNKFKLSTTTMCASYSVVIIICFYYYDYYFARNNITYAGFLWGRKKKQRGTAMRRYL